MAVPDNQMFNLDTYNLFMQAPVGFGLLKGKDHRMEVANAAFLTLTGRGQDAFGKPIADIFPEIAIQGYLKYLDQVILNKKTITLHESPAVFLKDHINETFFLNFVFQPYYEDDTVKGILAIITDVTPQVQSRKKVEESEERLRLAIETTKLGTWEFLPLTGELTWSDECKKIYEFPLDKEVDYALFSEHIYHEDSSFAQNAIAEAMNPTGEGTYDIEYRILRYSDKSIRWIRAQGKVFFNYDKPVKFIGTVLDITDAKLKEEAIRMNEERIRLAVEAGKLGTYELDEVNGEIIFSKRLAEMFGLDPSKNSKHFDLKQALHPDDVHIRDEAHKSSKKTGNLFYEARIIWPDGSVHWLRSNGSVVFDKYGKPLRTYGTTLDITEQKETEKILQESQQKFELIADAVPHMVWEIELDGRISYINKQWAEWSGLTLEEINTNSGWARVIHPDDVEAVGKGWMQAFETGNMYAGECRFKNPEGGYSWFTLKTVPVKNDNDEVELWIGTATDIDAKKISEQQKDSFITIASHELKTPVTTIKAYGQIAEAMLEKNGDTKTLDMIKKMGQQVNKLTTLISDLLDLSKIQQGKLMYTEAFFDFNELLQEVVDDMQKTSITHEIKTSFDTTAKVYGDKNKLSQVINNLISNAIKYSPKANSISIKTHLKKDGIELNVHDVGIGISEQDKEHVFEQFYRVSGSDQSTFPGMGIGLYICKEIITSHGGDIWVESIAGMGSTFHISLPFDHRSA